MGWTSASFRTPDAAQELRSQVAGALSAAPAALGDRAGRLAAVAGVLPLEPSPVAAGASGAATLRSQLAGLFAAGGRSLWIHPYAHPVGDRRGAYAYLTPQDAVAALAAKLADPVDAPPAGEMVAVCLMICGVEHGDFARALQAAADVFPSAALRMALRRARWLAGLETSKFLRPEAPAQPLWETGDPSRLPALARRRAALTASLAQLEAYAAEDVTPEDELAAVIAARRARLTAQDDAWRTLREQLAGGAGHVLTAQGDAAGIRRRLLAVAAPDAGYTLTMLGCWLGAPETMTFLRELLSV
ncbi:MAG: hypothetical protein PWQ57_2034 [Desulfovibrionales bacterium]|nr:hypothetical protein [Desulfovibrionales bacterium]